MPEGPVSAAPIHELPPDDDSDSDWARYTRGRERITWLLAGCLLLVLTGLALLDELISYTSPSVVEFGERQLLIAQESCPLPPDAPVHQVVRDLAAPGTPKARFLGRPIAAEAGREGELLIFGPSGCSIYDGEYARKGFARLPNDPPPLMPVTSADERRKRREQRLLELLAARRLGERILAVARTSKGLVPGELRQLEGGWAFRFDRGQLRKLDLDGLRELRLLRAGGRDFVAWATLEAGGDSTLEIAPIGDDGIGEPLTSRSLAGAVVDLHAAHDGERALLLLIRSQGPLQLEALPFDGETLGAARPIVPPRSRWPLLGVAAAAVEPSSQGPRWTLLLARVGSLERISGVLGSEQPWSGPEHLAGLTAQQKLLAVLLLGAVLASSLAVVVFGLALIRSRPAHVEHRVPFRIEAKEPPAPLWLRAAATALDGVLLLSIFMLVADPLFGTADLDELLRYYRTNMLLGHLCVCGLIVPYHLLFALLPTAGATPGKLLFELRIVDAAGEPASTRALVLRALAMALDTALLIGTLPMLITQLHQRFGDIWADTMVTGPTPFADEMTDDDLDEMR